MTQAAEQCREYIEEKHPGVRISRLACKDTTKGDISQHSAYDGYDSNALDIMGVVGGSWDENVAFIQKIVDDLNQHLEEWSIRKILWQVDAHFGHAHIDYYPMITIHKWCGGPETPTWRLSNGDTVTTRDPAPENGLYDGSEYMTFISWANGWYDALYREDIEKLHAASVITGNIQYWFDIHDKTDRTSDERAAVAHFYASAQSDAWSKA